MLRPNYCPIILSSYHLARYTWDCNTNRNIQSSFMLGRTAGPRCRFDRCYFKAAPLQSGAADAAAGVQLELVGKDLVGLETVDVHLPPLLPVPIGHAASLRRTSRTRLIPPPIPASLRRRFTFRWEGACCAFPPPRALAEKELSPLRAP
jgi:hypothetical protein